MGTGQGAAELGLYSRRIEARTLGELVEVLQRWGERTRQEPNPQQHREGRDREENQDENAATEEVDIR